MYLQLALISMVIGIPLAILFGNQWLNNFAYKVDIGAGVLLMGAMVTIIIVLLTVSYQCFKASLINPAHALRNE